MSTSMLVVARADRGGRTQRAVTAAIRGYRRVLSPRVPVRCRFEPSCSAYGLAAVEHYGTREGLRLAAARLRRCRPGVPYGTHDPVPSL
ncbi:MAG TPA: membrane protein insertion efficiency factor YidD [Actinoplanes sp.]|nr:membrane protein insertion efficiency factor YidD [Actinoplanes sp.]